MRNVWQFIAAGLMHAAKIENKISFQYSRRSSVSPKNSLSSETISSTVNCVDIFHLHFVLSQLNRERNLLSILEEAASEMRSLRVQGGRLSLSFSCLRSEWIALAKPRHKHYWSRSWTLSLAKMSHTIFISPEQQLEASVYDWFPIQRSHYQSLLKTNKQVLKFNLWHFAEGASRLIRLFGRGIKRAVIDVIKNVNQWAALARVFFKIVHAFRVIPILYGLKIAVACLQAHCVMF